jgi:uncharacterized membrane protein
VDTHVTAGIGVKIMKLVGIGNRSFAAAMVALGILGFVYQDFAMNWQKVPDWVPAREFLAYLCAATMLVCGVCLCLPRTAQLASCVLFTYLVLWLLLLEIPKVLGAPFVEVYWADCGETAILVAAAWVLLAGLFGSRDTGILKFLTGDRGIRDARFLYGLALIACGLAHFVYAQATADFIPEEWIPWHLAWAYLTGTAFLAAAAAILLPTRLSRPAASLSAVMMGVFTVMVWIPRVWTAPNERFQWTGLLISSAMAAAGWVIADSYRGATSPYAKGA